MLKGPRALLVTLLAIAAATLVTSAGPAAAAWAHAELVGSVPAAGATLSAGPSKATLTFSDPIDVRFVRVALSGPGGASQPVAGASGPTVTVPLSQQGPGGYRLVYRVVSADGHPVSGQLAFTVAGTPAAGVASASASVAGGPVTGSGSGAGGSSAVPIGVAIGLVVAAGAGGLWWVFGRERRG